MFTIEILFRQVGLSYPQLVSECYWFYKILKYLAKKLSVFIVLEYTLATVFMYHIFNRKIKRKRVKVNMSVKRFTAAKSFFVYLLPYKTNKQKTTITKSTAKKHKTQSYRKSHRIDNIEMIGYMKKKNFVRKYDLQMMDLRPFFKVRETWISD